MIRFPSKQFRYIYWIIFVVWLLISTHVAYMYVSFSSDSQSWKWGTFIEASVWKINYLPYATSKDEDKFYQSLLFNGCVYPSISGNVITYRDELCSVTTSDYKTFIITPKTESVRSDGSAFTLNDIYFTYNTILAENYWNIPSLDPYKSINILADETWTLEVIFPQASVDNMIFFTNFILPAHLLANKDLETYITSFYKEPVGTNCGRLHPTSNDPNSIVFDLSECDTTLLKYYQVKQFEDQQALETYLDGKKDSIDLIFSDNPHDGYQQNQVILNKFLTVFFNTKSTQLTPSLRKELASWMNSHLDRSTVEQPFLVKDLFLFDAIVPSENLTQERMETYLGVKQEEAPSVEVQPQEPSDIEATWTVQSLTTGWVIVKTGVVEQPDITSGTSVKSGSVGRPEGEVEEDLTIRAIPTTVNRISSDDTKEYSIETPIIDKQQITFTFDQAYDKVSVTHNDAVEYFPESYDPATKSTLYNFNIAYRNILEWRNVYTIKWYKNDQVVATFTLVVNYLTKPAQISVESSSATTKTFNTLTVIYFSDPTTVRLVEYLQAQLQKDHLLDYFTFESYTDSNTFAGKIESSDYDMVIREINMGLRKDISNLFTSTIPNINPSRYVNEELASTINKFFLVGQSQKYALKDKIDTIRWSDVPLVILGKALWTISIRSQLDFPYPFRLYVLGRRKDFINDLNLFDHLSINRDRLFDSTNFRRFLQENKSEQ